MSIKAKCRNKCGTAICQIQNGSIPGHPSSGTSERFIQFDQLHEHGGLHLSEKTTTTHGSFQSRPTLCKIY